MRGPGLNLIVAAAVPIVPARYGRPPMTDPVDISHEMRMVKSALLYADHVTVASWRVAMVRALLRARTARNTGHAVDLLMALSAVEWARAKSPSRGLPMPYQALEATPPTVLTVEEVTRQLGPAIAEGDTVVEVALRTKPWRELLEAEKLGLVDVMDMGFTTGFGFSREGAVAEYLALLADCTKAESDASPMLDYSSAGVLEVGRNVGILNQGPEPRTAEIGLVANYLGYVPAIVDADLAAVVRARDDLAGPLVRFRGRCLSWHRKSKSFRACPISTGEPATCIVVR